MDFYGTEKCFKTLFEVSFFGKKFPPRQKFLSLKSLKWCWFFLHFSNFDRVLPRPLEISGGKIGQMWATWPTLPKKQQKKQQMLKNDVFWDFWKFEIFDFFLPKKSSFQKCPLKPRNFCRPQKYEKMVYWTQKNFLGPLDTFLYHHLKIYVTLCEIVT